MHNQRNVGALFDNALLAHHTCSSRIDVSDKSLGYAGTDSSPPCEPLTLVGADVMDLSLPACRC